MKSQNNEAEIIINYFKDFTGTLLDIGANDGQTFSNSYDLIERGWSAHLLEPGETFALLQDLYKDNPNVKCHNIGIAEKSGVIPFYQSGAHVQGGQDRGLVSTAIDQERRKWKDVEFSASIAEFLSFDDFCTLNNAYYFDFISIDCEGMDAAILTQINLQETGCKCLCVEWNSQSETAHFFSSYCSMFGLTELSRNAENIIYIKP